MKMADVVVIVLLPGCYLSEDDALSIESIDEDNELLKSKKFLAVESGCNYGGQEKELFHAELQKKLFDHLETFLWQGSHEEDFFATGMESMLEGIPRRNYREEHELKALILELQLRASRLKRVTRPGRNAEEAQEEEPLVEEEDLVEEEALQDDESGFKGEDDFVNDDDDDDESSVADLDDYDGGDDNDGHEGDDKSREEEDVEDGVEDELKELSVTARAKLQRALREIARGAKLIDLKFADIEDAGAKVLAVADTSAKELAQVLANNTTITSLILGGNQIGVEGAKALAEQLAASSTLTTLDLGGNQIGVEDAKALAEGLAASSTLTTLE
ncbi:Nucleotide-binding oligomerization domain-containing protein 1 [Hondaea fermentalgiana]|uniref:Nucleotide-binding oligomerization domain-containing protein 1 n=1 Tax=Hondaea fermentalgiana TaxID=2315210 RepID=A0A2R5G816_9STRA|nr:Nucleotide-binding oligomerization domain-containing protein 1 [Hondaea fermentalgiana]|eukprot:GBG24181.1 Nucleotide-binding oligomerization domain-containing protein 1 [Hondaea fermentalgiana]